MTKRTTRNRIVSLLLAFILLTTTSLSLSSINADAVSKYIKINMFIKQLVQAIDLELEATVGDPYIVAATNIGIVKTGDFTNYTTYITRTDAALLLNRIDEYLHGDTVDAKLLEVILEKRISDINKIAKSKREAVAKIYAKGIIKGYGNGYYIQDRAFKGSNYLTSTGAKSVINLVVNSRGRAKISPDGQLIRSTKLPKNADSYEYILASFPNKFYEKKFEFMLSDQYKAGERTPELEVYPVDIRNTTFKTWNEEWPFSIEMDKYLYDWTELAENYLGHIFNVDYRTVDDEWIEGLGSLYAKSNENPVEIINTYYIDQMKENKVVIECSIIAIEPSSLYYDTGYCMRAYVHYRISAKNIKVKQRYLMYGENINFENLESGKWREGVFDIRFGTNNGSSGDGSYWAIDLLTKFDDSINTPVK